MNPRRLLLSASMLAAFTALLHTFGGTMEIHSPLLNSEIPERIRLMLYACWHFVSVALFLSALALHWLSRQGDEAQRMPLAVFIGVFWILCGFVFILVDLVFSGVAGLWELPQWILLIPIGVLSLYGARKSA